MDASKRVAVRDLNPHILCALCGGYLIQATTVIECLHSFCRTCIVNFLETSKVCPICDAQIHKTRPLLNIRPDQTLQSLVYKLVPGLFQDEMRRRREFHATLPKSELEDLTLEERGEASLEREYKHGDDHVSLALQMVARTSDDGSYKIHDTRYLLCPSELTVRHLKKFIRCKFQLDDRHEINLFRAKEELTDELMLQDIALIYSWRRDLPMNIVYTVREASAHARHKSRSTKDKVLSKPTDVFDKEECLSSTLKSIDGARKSSMQEISTESRIATLPDSVMEVTPPVVPSPPLVSPASPTLSSPHLFSPPFFSTPTILPVAPSIQKLPSNAAKQKQSLETTDGVRISSPAALHVSADVSFSKSLNTFIYSSPQDAKANKFPRSNPASKGATDEDSSSAISLSKYCKFSSPSPPTLELGPSVEQICSGINNTSSVNTTKEQNERSNLGPPLLQSQTTSSSVTVSSYNSAPNSAHCSDYSSTKCSPQTTHFKTLTSNTCPKSLPNSFEGSSSVHSKHTPQYPANSSISTSRQSLSQSGTDPNKLMHSVHSILNKSPPKRQTHAAPQPSTALRWTPVVEHKSPSISSTPQQPIWLSGGSSSNSIKCSGSREVKQNHQNQETKSLNSSNSVGFLKAGNQMQDIKSFSKNVGEVSGGNFVKPLVNDDGACRAKHEKDIKDFSGHGDFKSASIDVKHYGVSSSHKKVDRNVRKGEAVSPSCESKSVDVKSPKDIHPLNLKESKPSVKKAAEFESKKHLMDNSYSKYPSKKFSSFLPEQCLKTSGVSVKTEIDQAIQNKDTGYPSKDKHQNIQHHQGKSNKLTPITTSSSVTSVSGWTAVQDKNSPLHTKLKRFHSQTSELTHPDRVQPQTPTPPTQSTNIDVVSSYIPKYQKHKALYMSKRSVSCIEDSTATKTNGNSEQNMEKRNWKKRKLSTLDFDPSSSGFGQKQDKQFGDVSSNIAVQKNGSDVGRVSSGDSSWCKPRDKSSKSDKPHENQERQQSKADAAVHLYAERLSGDKGKIQLTSEQCDKRAMVSQTSNPTVSCLPIAGSIVTDPKLPALTSRDMPSGYALPCNSHIGANSKPAHLIGERSKDGRHTNYKTGKNNDSGHGKVYNSINDVNSMHNNNNNNNNNYLATYQSTKDKNNCVAPTTSSVHTNRGSLLQQGSIITTSRASQLSTKFTYTDVRVPAGKTSGSTLEKHQTGQPMVMSSAPTCPSTTSLAVDRTSCISVEVIPHSRGSPSDTGSTSSSATSPAADVTSPGTEDRADNSVMLDMQVAPSCGKTYLSPHLTGPKGLPLDLSSRKLK